MMEHIHETFGEHGFAIRVLAWAAGNIANYEIYQDIRDQCIDENIPYTVPEMTL